MLIDPTRTLIPSFGIAFFVTLTVYLITRRWGKDLESKSAARFAYSLGLALAVFVGASLLREKFARPEKFWHWLSIIGLVLGLSGPVIANLALWRRLVALLVVGLVAAFVLVPSWPNLEPGRSFYVPALAFYLILLAFGYQAAATRCLSAKEQGFVAATEWFFALAATTCALAASTAAITSLKYGELIGIVCVSLVGCFVAHAVLSFALKNDSTTTSASLVAMSVCGSVLIAGAAFVGFVYPQPPIYELLLLPLPPLAFLFAATTQTPWKRIALRSGLFLATLFLFVGVIVVRYGFE